MALAVYLLTLRKTSGGIAYDFGDIRVQPAGTRGGRRVVIWIMIPLLALVVFGLYVRREAERIRARGSPAASDGETEKLAGEGMATPGKVHLRRTIEDEIEAGGIPARSRILGSG